MDYTRLVDLYLEGEINPIEKDLLYRELSQNQELQEYLEEQIQFSKLFQNDFKTISVPSDATNAVFASLNFKIPNVATTPSVPIYPKFVANLKQFFGKFAPFFASSLVGGAVTFFLAWLFLPLNFKIESLNNQANLSSGKEIPIATTKEIPNISTSREIKAVNIERIIKETLENWLANYFKNYSLPNNSLARNEEQTPSLSFEPAILNKELPKIEFTNKDLSYERKETLPLNYYSNSPIANTLSSNNLTQKLRNITLGFRGYMLKSNPDVSVNLSEKGIIPNVGISLGYNIATNTNIGLEFGQEKFAQKYTLKRDGEVTYYKQNPLLWWYGLYIQQSISNLFQFQDIKPMARIFLGGTPVGPLARGAVGLQYTPDERVTLFLGWEATYLGYKVQNTVYQTKKTGVTYGVSVKY